MSCFTSKTHSPEYDDEYDYDPSMPTSGSNTRMSTGPGTRRNSESAPGTRRSPEFPPGTRRSSEFPLGTRRSSQFPPGTRRSSQLQPGTRRPSEFQRRKSTVADVDERRNSAYDQHRPPSVVFDGNDDLAWPHYDHDETQGNVNEYECKVICCEDEPEDMDAIDDVDVDVDVEIQEKYESQIKLYRLVVMVMIGALCIGTVMIMAAGKVSPGCKLENGQPCDAHMKKNVLPKTSCVNGGGVNNPGVKCQGQPMNFNKPPPCPQQANSRCTKPGP